ncbi:hypothetical protein [Rhizobium laguerreae]|uniref:hypothetical protein n=1 Tax=Rhizobium laguerreae TaxID=1076926 RepID=UPI0035E40998
MRAMVLEQVGRPDPPAPHGQVVVKVEACGVCRTDLHVCDEALGDLRAGRINGAAIIVP